MARIIDRSDTSLLDVIDNLLNQGVVLNADIILALANVDLVFIRLSAILCAADRIFPPDDRPSKRRKREHTKRGHSPFPMWSPRKR